MTTTTEAPPITLGTRVRFTRRMAGFKVVRYSDGPSREQTTDPTDGLPDRWRAASERLKDLVDDKRRGTFRVVVDWEIPERRDYELRNHDTGIVVGKTFRYEGEVLFDSDEPGFYFMVGVGGFEDPWQSKGKRVECWEVKQTLNRRPVLVPIDAIEALGD